jgi:hypothetical protein
MLTLSAMNIRTTPKKLDPDDWLDAVSMPTLV